MSNDDVFETSEDGRYRVRIVQDDQPSEPEDDGGSPVLYLSDRGYSSDAHQVKNLTSYEVSSEIVAALRHWHQRGHHDFFERYLRVFHGATSIVWHETYSDTYVTFDTAHWREAMGLTDEYMAAHQDVDFRLANMDEYIAYLDGDVYGIVVEENVTWTTEADYDDRETWEHVESCWGYYGVSDYTKDEARRMLAEAVGE